MTFREVILGRETDEEYERRMREKERKKANKVHPTLWEDLRELLLCGRKRSASKPNAALRPLPA
jgi:hypothetical protein